MTDEEIEKIRKQIIEMWEKVNKYDKEKEADEFGIGPSIPNAVDEGIDDYVVYNVEEVACFLGLSRRHVARLCKAGEIRSFQTKPRGEWRIWGEDVRAYAKKHFWRK